MAHDKNISKQKINNILNTKMNIKAVSDTHIGSAMAKVGVVIN